MISLPHIAALRAFVGPEDGDLVFVRGSVSAWDGWEGWYCFDASSSEQDDGGNFLAPDDGTDGRWRSVGPSRALGFSDNRPSSSAGVDGDVRLNNALGSALGWKKVSGSWVPIVRVIQVPSSEIAAITKIQTG